MWKELQAADLVFVHRYDFICQTEEAFVRSDTFLTVHWFSCSSAEPESNSVCFLDSDWHRLKIIFSKKQINKQTCEKQRNPVAWQVSFLLTLPDLWDDTLQDNWRLSAMRKAFKENKTCLCTSLIRSAVQTHESWNFLRRLLGGWQQDVYAGVDGVQARLLHGRRRGKQYSGKIFTYNVFPFSPSLWSQPPTDLTFLFHFWNLELIASMRCG